MFERILNDKLYFGFFVIEAGDYEYIRLVKFSLMC